MTLMIFLGGAAALYLLWLLFRLAAFALPVYTGAGTALLLDTEGYGIAAVLTAGFMAGLAVHLTGQLFVTSTRSLLLRFLVGLLFAAPAAFAGHQAVAGLAGLVVDDNLWVRCLSFAGGLATASAAWRGLGSRAQGRDERGPLRHEATPSFPTPLG